MKNIKADLIHYTPENCIVNAVAKPYKNERASVELAKKVGVILKHESILEHISLNFDIRGISRLCLQELVRHRIGSYTVESTRYTLQKLDTKVDLKQCFVFPPFESEMTLCDYESYCENSLYVLCSMKKRLKNDQLKYFLPENFRTNLSMTINLRSFRNFLELRDSESAHFEIRHLSKLMRAEVEKTYIGEFL